MSQDIKHDLIKLSYYITFPAAGLHFLTFAQKTNSTILSNIVGVLGIAFTLFCIVCSIFLSEELQQAEDAEMYKRQAEHYANLYYEEVKHHGKTTKKENETS